MKFDVNVLRYLSKDEYRVLVAVEVGQKNVSSGLCSGSVACWRIWPAHALHCGVLLTAGVCVPVQHEIVPATLIDTIAALRCGSTLPVAQN